MAHHLTNNLPFVASLLAQLTVINAKNGGCYRCLFPRSSNSCQSCADGGVLGPVVGTLGTLQATEAIKVLVGGEVLVNKLLVYDAFSSPVFRTVGIPPRKKCALCGENPSIKTLEDSKVRLDEERSDSKTLYHLPKLLTTLPALASIASLILTLYAIRFPHRRKLSTLRLHLLPLKLHQSPPPPSLKSTVRRSAPCCKTVQQPLSFWMSVLPTNTQFATFPIPSPCPSLPLVLRA